MIGCEDCLRNDLYCVEWGVKLYSNQPSRWLLSGKTQLSVLFIIVATSLLMVVHLKQLFFDSYWHYPHYNAGRTRKLSCVSLSVCPSVTSGRRTSLLPVCCCGPGPSARRYRSTAAAAACGARMQAVYAFVVAEHRLV